MSKAFHTKKLLRHFKVISYLRHGLMVTIGTNSQNGNHGILVRCAVVRSAVVRHFGSQLSEEWMRDSEFSQNLVLSEVYNEIF